MRPSRTEQLNLIQTLRAWLAKSICAPVLILLLPAAFSLSASAQQIGSLTGHLNDNGAQLGRDSVSVSAPPAAFPGTDRPDTGSVLMNFPIVDLPGRGPGVKLSLNYDSGIYQLDTNGRNWFVRIADDIPQNPTRGFSFGYGKLIEHNIETKCRMTLIGGGGSCPSPGPGPSYINAVTFIDETGAKHRIINGLSTDSSDLRYSTQNGAKTITYPDGTTYVFGPVFKGLVDSWNSPPFQYGTQSVCVEYCDTYDHVYYPVKIIDRNGNFISITRSGGTITSITDTLGREVKFNYENSRLASIDVPGFTPNTRREIARFFYRTVTVTPNFRDQTQGNGSYTFVGMESIYIPGTNSGWHFDYSSYGQIWEVKNLVGMQYDAATKTLTSLGTEVAKTSYAYHGTPLNPNTSLLYTLPNYSQRIDEWLSDPSDPAQPRRRTVHKYTMDYSSEITLKRSITYIEAPNGTMNVIRKRYYRAEDHTWDWSKTWDEGVTLEEKAQIGSKIYRQINYTWEKTDAGARPIEKILTNDIGQQRKFVYKFYNPNDPNFPGVKNYMNVREIAEYGFDGTLLRRTVADYVRDSLWTNRWLIKLPKRVQVFDGNSTTPSSQVDYDYDTEALTSYTDILTGAGMMYDTSTPVQRGNLTKVTSYTNAANQSQGATVAVKFKYDIVGNTVESTDANNGVSQVEYGTEYRRAMPTKLTTPTPDPTGNTGSMQGFTTINTFNFNTGQLVSSKDQNDQLTTYDYSDPINRLKKVSRPDGGSTTYTYTQTPTELSVGVSNALDNTRSTQFYEFVDGRGWSIRKQVFFGDGTYSTIDKEFDDLGRVARVSNPYLATLNGTRAPNPDNRVWTVTGYDPMGRTLTVTTPDNVKVKTDYDGERALTTDQAGNQHLNKLDELGRMIDVWEIVPSNSADPNAEGVSFPNHAEVTKGYHTSYKYDVLNNLRKVQQGAQARFFHYDSLSRMLALKLPEQEVNSSLTFTDPVTTNTQWSMSYDYDNKGNLRHMTDPRGVLTTYNYDAQDRVTSRTYANDTSQTPPVSYKYDGVGSANGVPFSKGMLTSISTSGQFVSSCTYDEFDVMGRIRQSTETIESNPPFVMHYAYDLAGNMISQTYPSGRVVITEMDDAGRVAGIRKQSSNDYYVGGSASAAVGSRSIQYAADGSIKSLGLGNGLWETIDYSDHRLQVMSFKLGTTPGSGNRFQLDYDYFPLNNGNIKSQKITVPTVNSVAGAMFTQNYQYDALNRLKDMSEVGGLAQSYEYDQFGNRAVASGFVGDPRTPQQLSAYDPATNRLRAKEYDKNGNITRDAIGQGHSYQYDGENRLYSLDGGVARYSYDGQGQRVKVVTPGGTLLLVRNIRGEVVAEYGGPPPVGAGGTSYVTSDGVGTPRVITGTNISDAGGGIKARHDYLPFGEELVQRSDGQRNTTQGYVASDDNVRQKFLGLERDKESGLDLLGARYYSSTQGRFMTVDPLTSSGTVGNPQSWNRYTYGFNNPIVFADPSGLDPMIWLQNLTTKLFFSVTPEVYESEYKNDSNFQVVTNVGPDGLVFPLTKLEGRYANDPEYQRLLGMDVFMGEDGRFHAASYQYPTVFIWDGTGWGASRAGHVSYGIDGLMWSWEKHGWHDPPQSIGDYIRENQAWRSGTAYQLDFSGATDDMTMNNWVKNSLKTGYDNIDNGAVLPWFSSNNPNQGGYNLLQNNCGESFCRMTNNMRNWGLPHNDNILPSSHGEYIRNNMAPYIKNTYRIEQKQ
ncbi:MAG TPA: RHS repeat-associated core domain-containing protein [Pyrinomonadaceae bacterium]|nr:RHS repeat-associated core domain-containing protein [Pyrinomonadaceae bacterium]